MSEHIVRIIRLILGFIFLVAGINGYFVIFDLEPFIPTSPEAMSLFQFKYLLVIEKSLEILCGILLITNQFIPLTVVILAPITANIFLLHLFRDRSLLLLAILIVLCHAYLGFFYRGNFRSLLLRKPDN
jgi:uncharacterized membrane protein YphA (DoxX/SURF4 family)